tara:strand:+ start:1 stop:1065 length:1065 start_codon:yes stop_codon:yes gene_type:complete
METPVNNYFGEPQSPEVLSPLNVQSPTQGFFNTQMQNTGLQSPTDVFTFGPDQTGGDDGATGGGYNPINPDEGSGVPTGPGTDGETSMGSGRFFTSDADLMSNFLSGLGEKRASELTGYLEDNTLDFDELAALAGLDVAKLKADGEYNRVKTALQGQFGVYSDVFENVPNQLRNLQELRGNLLGQELTDASQAYGNLMDFVDQGSVSGLEMGITETRTEQATQSLENALQQQLTSAEGQYLNELDSLLSTTAGDLSKNLAEISTDFISQNKDLAEYLVGTGSDTGSGSSGTQTQGGNPATYNQIYQLYNIDSQDMQTIQSYINTYFMDNNYFPTTGELDAYIQSLGYGQDEDMV